jgi:hypothetical protein
MQNGLVPNLLHLEEMFWKYDGLQDTQMNGVLELHGNWSCSLVFENNKATLRLNKTRRQSGADCRRYEM